MVCDASTYGLGAALEQNTKEGSVAIAHASKFLNSLEEKNSVNELELLGVVWAIEHFKYYLYGKNITVITDHQALISALNASEQSKTSQIRLTRCIGPKIPFNFDVKHLAGNKIGLIDYPEIRLELVTITLVRTMRNLLWRQSTHSLRTHFSSNLK